MRGQGVFHDSESINYGLVIITFHSFVGAVFNSKNVFQAKQMHAMDSEQTPSLTPHMLLEADLFGVFFILYSKVNGTPTFICCQDFAIGKLNFNLCEKC